VVAGTTVGTAEVGTTAPAKDASGFWHFKPSCYGYLDASSMSGGGISLVQNSPEAGPSTAAVIPKLPAASTAGNLLVATVRSDTNPSNKPFTAPAGWVSAVDGRLDGTAHTTIFYYPNNPGGITTVSFGVAPNSIDAVAQLSEWSGASAAPLDQTGIFTSGSNQSSATISTGGAMASANELVITGIGALQQSPQLYTRGAGWTALASDMSTEGYASEYRTNLAAGVASETVTVSKATSWASVIATFKPAAGAGSGVVLDPGFYYFNGKTGNPAGLCLNNGMVLASDVTLEFVNAAGFSSGTCAAGGGAACAGAKCEFGSTPCSISVCPPNAGADSPNNLTWFSAPCSAAPAGDAASCTGTGWCPNGDRACWNLLIWAPSSGTGGIAIKGAAAKHWLLGSVFWPGTCTDSVNGTSMIAGTIQCGTLSISAAAGAGLAIGGDYGISTALVEAVLIE
jgi:hypothetical protein